MALTFPDRRALAAAILGLLLLPGALGSARAGEGLFGEPPGATRPAPEKEPPPVLEREPAPEPLEGDLGPREFYRRLWLSLDLDYRRRKLRPVRVDDRYDDFEGDVHYDERLKMRLYDSEDIFQTATLGLALHWRPLSRLELYAGVRRPIYGKAEHREIEYDHAPIASPRLELDHGASVEVVAGAGWEFLRLEGGPLRHFGMWAGAELRAGWADDIKSPNDDEEFNLDGNDEVEYDADWQALDLELRVFRRFEGTTEGLLTVYAGAGTGFLFYHEEWDGEFENGDERDRMEFEYREQNLVFGSVGLRGERGPLVVEVGGRFGGEYLVQAKLGWKF
jgi:hypothetical protein